MTQVWQVLVKLSEKCEFHTIEKYNIEIMFNQVFRYFVLPEDVVSDRGLQFTSQVWHCFLEKLGVTVSLTSGYHPEANGQVEKINQENQSDRVHFLHWAEHTQNSLRHSATGLTPFQCVLGFQPPLFPWNASPISAPAVDQWFRRSEHVWELVHR